MALNHGPTHGTILITKLNFENELLTFFVPNVAFFPIKYCLNLKLTENVCT